MRYPVSGSQVAKMSVKICPCSDCPFVAHAWGLTLAHAPSSESVSPTSAQVSESPGPSELPISRVQASRAEIRPSQAERIGYGTETMRARTRRKCATFRKVNRRTLLCVPVVAVKVRTSQKPEQVNEWLTRLVLFMA